MGKIGFFAWFLMYTLLDLAMHLLIHHIQIFSVTYAFLHLLIQNRFTTFEWKFWWKHTFINTEQSTEQQKEPLGFIPRNEQVSSSLLEMLDPRQFQNAEKKLDMS